jgi:hypothetical protein
MTLDTAETQQIDLVTYFQERNETLKALDQKLSELAEKLLALVPQELQVFKAETLSDINKWLCNLAFWSAADTYMNDKIKDPQDYGFTGLDDAYNKMQLLKKAWAGIIDIEITREKSYIEVKFKLPKTTKVLTTNPKNIGTEISDTSKTIEAAVNAAGSPGIDIQQSTETPKSFQEHFTFDADLSQNDVVGQLSAALGINDEEIIAKCPQLGHPSYAKSIFRIQPDQRTTEGSILILVFDKPDSETHKYGVSVTPNGHFWD